MRSKSSQNAVNIINFITFLVTVIGAAALFIVLSGFAGLKEFSLSFSQHFDPDLKALPKSGKFFHINAEQEAKLQKIKGITFFSKELEEQVYFSHNQKAHIGYVKGIDSMYTQVIDTSSLIYFGDWKIKGGFGVAGIGIINTLNLSINNYRDPLTVLVPKPGTGSYSQQTQATPYNKLPLVISGVYSVEQTLDHKYVFIELAMAQALTEKEATQVSGINVKTNPDIDQDQTIEDIKAVFNDTVIVKTRRMLNSSLHKMLNTENLATYLIFTLVLIIALFNVVGATIMMILDKQKSIKTLYNLGSTIFELRKIYFFQGVLVTAIGGIMGVFIGSLLIGSQLAFGWLTIGETLAYPVAFKIENVGVVLLTIFVLGVIAAFVASSRISKKLISN